MIRSLFARIFILQLVLAPLVDASTFRTQATGNANVLATYTTGACGTAVTPASLPTAADIVKVCDGHKLTIPLAYTLDVGSSPADDTTVGFGIDTNAGTGQIEVLGKLIYRAHVVLGSGGLTQGPGAEIVHGGVTQNYSIVGGNTNNNGFKWTVNGTTGSHAKWRKATVALDGFDAINSGGEQCQACFQGTNNLHATFFDVTNQGTATIEAWVMPNNASYATDEFYCESCDWGSNGRIDLTKLSPTGTLSLTNFRCHDPLDTLSNSCVLLKGFTTLTSGTRLIQHFFIQNMSWLAPDATNTGVTVTDGWFVNFGAKAPTATEGANSGAFASFHDIGFYNDSTSGGLNAQIPAGDSYRIVGLRTGGAADADLFEFQKEMAATHLTQCYGENQNNDEQGDFAVMHTDAVSAATAIEIDHCVAPLNDSGKSIGGFFTTVGAWTNARPNIHHITFGGNTVKGLLDQENAVGPAGGLTGPANNIIYYGSSIAGFFTATAGGVTATDGTYLNADYNFSNNISGTPYLKGNIALTNAKFNPNPPGAHDQTGKNPQFLAQRHFLAYCQAHDASITTWTQCIAKFEAIGTATFDSYYSAGPLYDWLVATWKPTNPIYRNADSSGTGTPGAQPGVFGCSTGITLTGAGC